MPQAPKVRRRWYQFSLGMLFVVVTALAVFLAYQVNWIRQQHTFLDRSQAEWDVADTTIGEASGGPIKLKTNASLDVGPYNKDRRAPTPLWLFGEKGHWVVSLLLDGPTSPELKTTDNEKIHDASGLFPEAAIQGIHLPAGGGKLWDKLFVEIP
jgi:hypothetical protein